MDHQTTGPDEATPAADDGFPGAGGSGGSDRPDGSEGVGGFEETEGFDAFADGPQDSRRAGTAPAYAADGAPADDGSAPRAASPAGPQDGGAPEAGSPADGSSLFATTTPQPRVARPVRDPLATDLATTSGAGPRVRRVVAGDYLLTVNPLDGSEVALCPPAERPVPVRRSPGERVARAMAARPVPPPGRRGPELPLLERDEERERLLRLLARGRSVRVTGPSGVGRTALLESVAAGCAALAPDGVLRLSGYHRTPADLLQDLYAAFYRADGHRPDRAEVPGLLREIGAVVVLDDLECGGAALEEVLAAAPECAFLMAATPDVPAPSPESMVEEVFLSGLTRAACSELLHLAAGRELAEDEAAWAADLWFESEGLPLRFVQAGALLRQRDVLRRPPEPGDADDSVWENGSPSAAGTVTPALPDLTGFDPPPAEPAPAEPVPPAAPAPRLPASAVPLPSLAESAAPAALLASRLGESPREALVFAVALDGECPHPSHLPALVGDTRGDTALGELTAVGLAVPVAAHYRLAAGVTQQLAGVYAEDGELSGVQAHTAALHYTWWTGHGSVTPERAAAEAEAILAAMSACRDGGHASAAVLLGRTVAPAFAAALHWGAWERALRIGQEAARLSGEVAEEAYFHHELGVLALCTGNFDRARAELEASIALRGALGDRQSTLVGRRALALVDDRAGASAPAPLALPAPDPAPDPVPALAPPLHAAPLQAPATVVGKQPAAPRGNRRNLVAIATGVALAAALGAIVTLGNTSSSHSTPNQVTPIESAPGGPATTPATDDPTGAPTTAGPPSATTTASASASASVSASAPAGTSRPAARATTPLPAGTTSPPPPQTTAPGGTTGGGLPPTASPSTRTTQSPTATPPSDPSPTTTDPTTPSTESPTSQPTTAGNPQQATTTASPSATPTTP